MNSENYDYTEASLLLMMIGTVLSQRQRKIWSRQYLLRRKAEGCYENLMRELALEDAEGYRRCLQMDTSSFEILLKLVSPLISKKDTKMRKAISPGDKLALTLRYLASGETQSCLAIQFRIAQNTISGILKLVCNALVTVLQSHLRTPSTEAEWHAISEQFKSKWQFPMCIGALNGKHVKISPPPKFGSLYCSYNGEFSIAFIALVDANLKFICADVSTKTRISDIRIWENCKLKIGLEKNLIKVPKAQYLPETQTKVPFVVVADNAFPLKYNMMKRFPDKGVNEEEKIFNYRLSRAQRVSENAFGILAARFQIFKQKILTDPINATNIVLACSALHNFLLSRNPDVYVPPSSIDVEDAKNKSIRLGGYRNYSSDAFVPLTKQQKKPNDLAKDVRRTFCTYFSGIGAVPWQKDMCLLH